MHPTAGVVPTSLLAVESGYNNGLPRGAGAGGAFGSYAIADDLASAGAAGRGVVTATGQCVVVDVISQNPRLLCALR